MDKRGQRIAQRRWHIQLRPSEILVKMIIQSTAKIEKRNRSEHLFKVMKKIPVLPSREKVERSFVDSASKSSISRTILIWGEAARNMSLNKGSLKQLLPVLSN